MKTHPIRGKINLAAFWAGIGLRQAVEVGTYEGAFAEVLLSRLALDKLVCVDPWAGTGMSHEWDGDALYADVGARLSRRFGARTELLRMTSEAAAPLFTDGSLDLVYIDGLHDYASVVADIGWWMPKVAVGGILGGHDFVCRRGKNAKGAVLDTLGGDRLHVTSDRCPSWWVIKT